MTQTFQGPNLIAPERLPLHTHFEWGQGFEPRLERMHSRGGIIALNHNAPLPGTQALSAEEEIYLALESAGMDIPRMAQVTEISADTIAYRRKKLISKLGVERVTNVSGRLAAVAFEEGIFNVVRPARNERLPRAMIEVTYNTAQGRSYTEMGDLLGMDLNSVRSRSYNMKQKLGLDNSAAMVFYGYASGLLKPVSADPWPSTPLPEHVRLELSQTDPGNLRLERIHFHGGRLAIMHRVPLGRNTKVKPLTHMEELTIALGATGQSEAQTAQAVYRTEDRISEIRNAAFRKLRLPSDRNSIGQAITVARNKGVFLVEQPMELEAPLSPKRTILLEVLAKGGTRMEASQAVGYSLDTINVMIKNIKDTYQLSKWGELVLLGHMSGALALERTLI